MKANVLNVILSLHYLQKTELIRRVWEDKSRLPPGNSGHSGAGDSKVALGEKQKVLTSTVLSMRSRTNYQFHNVLCLHRCTGIASHFLMTSRVE